MQLKLYYYHSGTAGCIPDFRGVAATIKDAIDSLDCVHELTDEQREELQKSRYVRLEDGADYADIESVTATAEYDAEACAWHVTEPYSGEERTIDGDGDESAESLAEDFCSLLNGESE